MQEKLRTSELSREKLGRKYQDMLASVLAGSPHHHLAVELQAIRNAYSQLDREYHMLRDKYARLKGARGTGHVTQQQVLPVPSQGPVPVAQVHWGHNPMAYTQRQPASDVQIPGPQPQGQSRSHPVSPTSSIYPGDLQGSLQQQENHTRRRSEGVSQQQLQRGSSPIATTWLPALPTPPPTAPLYRGPISPSAFPVHAPMQPVPVGGYPPHSPAHNALPIHTPMTYRSRSVSGPAMSPQARHLVGQDAIYVPSSRGATHNAQAGPPTPPESSASQWMHSLKRPNSVLLASDSQQGELKKPRIEGEAQRQVSEPTTAGVDTPNQSPPRATSVTPNAPSSAKSSPTGPTDAQSNSESVVSDSVKDIRSFEECVNLIFEKDADVEHGVFCGLCL
ncbi:hypothetical protein BS17DRAFT_497254 [Gyrodon lividus]|nr:hypothetical protein BS17DRAFT_497254 [Gyrodon lividus]